MAYDDTLKGNLVSEEGSMTDAMFTVAVFGTLGLSIVVFGAWARKRVP